MNRALITACAVAASAALPATPAVAQQATFMTGPQGGVWVPFPNRWGRQ